MEFVNSKLTELLGAKNVSADPIVLARYASDKSFTQSIAPSVVVNVQNAEQVEALVKWANETKTPLVPVSSGGPHHKGDTVPSVPGAVIVDLSKMKKVISINRTHRIAIVEPGVTYGEFLDALRKEKLTVSMPLAPRATKSVVGSVLETEPRLNALHQWCFLDPIRCVEVTWGDGTRMYTGEAAMAPMNLEQQWKKEMWQWEAVGPLMLDYYRLLTGAQGSMGIVSWASVRCELMPQAEKMYIVPANTLSALIDFAYKTLRLRFSDQFFIMNRSQLACLMGKDAKEVNALREMLPPWAALVGICGRDFLPKERVAAQEADIAEIAQAFRLKFLPSVPGLNGSDVLKRATTPCEDGAYWKETYKGAFQDIFFVTTLDRSEKFIEAMYKLAGEAGYKRDDIGVYLQPENMGTSYHCSFTLPYNPDDRKETATVKKLFEKASNEFASLGAYYMRPYGIWSRLQLNKDAQSYQALQLLKGIFDPNGIMNPGKLSNN